MKNIFINPTEHRLRAFWRLAVQALLYFVGIFFIQIPLGILVAVLAVSAGVPMTDSSAMQAYAVGLPWLNMTASLGSLAAIIFSYFICAKIDKRPWKDFGFHFSKQWWQDFGFGLFLGAILMVFIFSVEYLGGWIEITGTFAAKSGFSFPMGMLMALVMFICVGFSEEMLSRGYQIRNLAEGIRGRFLSPKMALLVSYLLTSSLFGFMHAGNPNATLMSSLFLVIAGLFLGLAYVLTGELAAPIGLHISWNFFQGNVFGFPVSGTQAGSTFIAIQQGGPALWTGGPFGPEAGLIGLVAIAIGCGLIFLWVKATRKEIKLNENLAVYSIPGGMTVSAAEMTESVGEA